MTHEIKQGNLEPPLIAVCIDRDGNPVDLSAPGTTVRLYVRNSSTGTMLIDGKTLEILADPVVIDGTTYIRGGVRYKWAVGETDVVGIYEAELEVSLPDANGPLTFPNNGFIVVKVYDSIRVAN